MHRLNDYSFHGCLILNSKVTENYSTSLKITIVDCYFGSQLVPCQKHTEPLYTQPVKKTLPDQGLRLSSTENISGRKVNPETQILRIFA